MKWRKLTQKEAEEIAEWKYPFPYDFYDMTADPEDYEEFLSPEQRGEHTYSAYDEQGLVGFLTMKRTQENVVDIGLGMDPSRTGKGGGEAFIRSGLNLLEEQFGDVDVTLSVATFNQRAIKVYERLGFVPVMTFEQNTNGSTFPFVKMEKS